MTVQNGQRPSLTTCLLKRRAALTLLSATKLRRFVAFQLRRMYLRHSQKTCENFSELPDDRKKHGKQL